MNFLVLAQFWEKLDTKFQKEVFNSKKTEYIHPSNQLISKNFLIDQENIARELIKSGVYTTNWDNPELWVKLLVIVTGLMLILAVLPLILSPKRTNIEKATAYECGFAPFFIKEGIIEIQFVVVALLFLIFDLEVVYLVPLALNVGILGSHILSIFLIYVHLAWLMLAVEGFTGALSWPTWLVYSKWNYVTEGEQMELPEKTNK